MGGDAPPVNSVASGIYVLGEKLGAGSFGTIYVGEVTSSLRTASLHMLIHMLCFLLILVSIATLKLAF